MKEIQLTQGKVALIDDDDYVLISQRNWYFDSSNGYAVNKEKQNDGSFAKIYMHRLLLGVSEGDYVDHVDRDKLNNTRKNIRKASQSQNSANKEVSPSSRTGYKGVSYTKEGTFRARIKCQYKEIHIGTFKTKEKAAEAYNEKAKELFGDFAVLNEIDREWANG